MMIVEISILGTEFAKKRCGVTLLFEFRWFRWCHHVHSTI